MAWVEFHAARIKRLQKFRDFRGELGWSVNEALGFLGNLWGEVIELREDGDICGWRPEYLSEVTGVKAAVSERLWDALVKHGWIEPAADGRVLLHDWLDCAGRYLDGKYRTADPGRLMMIWNKHGRKYDLAKFQRQILRKSQTVLRQSLDCPPYLTLPNLTVPDHNGSADKPRGRHGDGPGGKDGAARTPTPLQEFVVWYLKDCEGLPPPNSDDSESRKKYEAAFKRFVRPAKQVLDMAGGSVDKAQRGTRGVGQYLQSRNLTWTIDTVGKWFLAWERGELNGKS